MAEIETMNWPVVDYSGKEIGEVSLDKFVFGLSEEEQNAYAVQAAVKTYLANRRQATAKTKNRSEVSGSGKKLWKQRELDAPVWETSVHLCGDMVESYSDLVEIKTTS